MFGEVTCSQGFLFFVFYSSHLFFLKFIYLFIYFWLCWVFVSVRGLSLVVVSGGHSSSRCAGLSLSRPLLLRSTGSRRAGSVVVAHGPSCCAACGIFPDQGSNPCPLHWQEDSQSLHHQGSSGQGFFTHYDLSAQYLFIYSTHIFRVPTMYRCCSGEDTVVINIYTVLPSDNYKGMTSVTREEEQCVTEAQAKGI